MRLVSFETAPYGDKKIGALVTDDSIVVDLQRALRAEGSADGQLAGNAIPGDMTAFLEGGVGAMDLARKGLDYASSLGFESLSHPRSEVRLLAPVPRPRKVLGIGGNFPELAATWPEPPAVPPVFQRAASTIVGPEDEVIIPAKVTYLQPEMEVCAVIGKRCRNVAVEDAYDVVAGYMIGNDLSDIDVLMSQWVTRRRPDLVDYNLPTEAPYNIGLAFQSKSWDTTGPTGPCLVTAEEIDPEDLEFEFGINGEVIQTGNTRDMLIKISEQIAYYSSVLTLEPGDILFTGARSHTVPVKDGDILNHKISRLGSFDTRCVSEK